MTYESDESLNDGEKEEGEGNPDAATVATSAILDE